MFSKQMPSPRSRDEGEKPFWISFADLMTAMMILFGRHGRSVKLGDAAHQPSGAG